MCREGVSFKDGLSDFLKNHPYQNVTIGEAFYRFVIAGDEDKPCIVFLNGGMNSSEMWFGYVEKLSTEYRTLIFDYPIEIKDCDSLAASVHELLITLGIKKAFFAGASFGGLMAQIFAAKYPETVMGLGLFSTAGLDENTIRRAKKKYCMLPFLLRYIKRCDYEKLKPKYISVSMKKYAKNETPENKYYLQGMFECIFEDYTREKDIHITSIMAELVNIQPCHLSDFDFVKDKVLLIFPQKDFFSKSEQTSLNNLFPEARTEYVINGHFGTVVEIDKYVQFIKETFVC